MARLLSVLADPHRGGGGELRGGREGQQDM
jgi:hypothetical protein